MAFSKVFALFALLALCAAGASATTCPQYLPPMMQPLSLTMLQQQYCMTMQGIMSPQFQQCGAMWPISQMQMQLASFQQQRCMSPMMCSIMSPQCQCGAMFPTTQMLMQLAPFQQQCCVPPVMQGMMAPWCQCGGMCQMQMQPPYMYNTAAMVTPLAYRQQFVAACAC